MPVAIILWLVNGLALLKTYGHFSFMFGVGLGFLMRSAARLGLTAVKSGMIDAAGHPLWRRARRWRLGPGVVLGLVGAAIWQWGPPVPGIVLSVVSSPVATLGYLGLIASLSRPPGPIMGQALKAGGSSLSIYLGQSIVLSTICSGYCGKRSVEE